MNRFAFIGSQTDEKGQEWCYILDTQTGTTLKSPVKAFGAAASAVDTSSGANVAPVRPIFPTDTVTAPSAVKKDADPTGEIETPEQRKARLGTHKVPPAFMGDIRRMQMDPAKNANGITDVTPHN